MLEQDRQGFRATLEEPRSIGECNECPLPSPGALEPLMGIRGLRGRCRTCGNLQPASKLRSPFMHHLDCKARRPVQQYLLREQHQIFQEKARLGFYEGGPAE